MGDRWTDVESNQSSPDRDCVAECKHDVHSIDICHGKPVKMVQGMAFLSKKGFNPQNQSNRKQVWEAQQDSKLEKERIRKREEQLRREREDEELCAARHNGDGSQAQLRFMYDAPPGLNKKETDDKEESVSKSSESERDITKIQPGDDDAAAEFRRMLAASVLSQTVGNETLSDQGNEKQGDTSTFRFAPVLQGSTTEQDFKNNDTRSALEKAVGRKDRGSALTLEEQIQRFPQLKNAPMAKGMSTTDVNVNFKPLGSQLRNVKCLACGVWGHSRGDRECQMTGWDPFSSRPAAAVAASSIQLSKIEKQNPERRPQKSDDRSTSTASSSSSGTDDNRRRRKRKHRENDRRRDRDDVTSRERSRKSRSRSPSRRSRSHKSHSKKRSRREH